MSLLDITTRITDATARANRPAGSVTLIAVSKIQPEDRIRAILDQGQRTFGENYVAEAEDRWPHLAPTYPGVTVHMIGPLQSNKVARALTLFDAIHTLDRERLARRLADAVQARGTCPTLFVQVNTGREPQKAGIDPDALDTFIATCRQRDLPLAGLMAIPPAGLDPEPHFRMLADLAARNGLTGLSMGMSDDFEIAVACGATHVRVGSALFGARIYA